MLNDFIGCTTARLLFGSLAGWGMAGFDLARREMEMTVRACTATSFLGKQKLLTKQTTCP